MKVLFALLLFFFFVSATGAEDQSSSNLVFVIDKSLVAGRSILFKDEHNEIIDKVPWFKQDSDFYRNFILSRKRYTINLPEGWPSVVVTTKPGQPTYLRLSPQPLGGGIVARQITTWNGPPGPKV